MKVSNSGGGCLVAKSCCCDPKVWSLLSSSVYGIFQARILEWVAVLKILLQGIFPTQGWKPRLLSLLH